MSLKAKAIRFYKVNDMLFQLTPIVICDINYWVVLLLFKMCHLVYCANYILFFPFKRYPLNTDLPQMGQ